MNKELQRCSICGCLETETPQFRYHTKYGDNLCDKHYHQLYKYGRILERTTHTPNEIILYEDYAEIVLYNQKCEEVGRTIIDLEDVEKCKKYKLFLNKTNYVDFKLNGSIEKLHRFLMNAKGDEIIDHMNHNPLDNRKKNLRVCTQTENSKNTSKPINNTSGIIGVSWSKSRNKWVAQIKVNYKAISLGRYVNKDDAIIARLKAEAKYFGEFAPQRHLFEQYGIEGDLNGEYKNV